MVVPPQNPPDTDLTIARIGRFLEPELAGVERLLGEIIDSDSRLVREVGDYLNLTGGKKLRPMLTLLVARAFGAPERNPPPIEIAAALEAVHVATLLHDDVIDEGQLRRGQRSVNASWSNDVAILMADYLFSAAFELATRHLESEPLRMICQATRRMCEGELFQIERRDQWLTPNDYLYIITCKTACLFSACTALGGSHARLDSDALARLTAFGIDFGLAFQITDDALDYTAHDSELGKPAGLDLASGKQTLPLILAMGDATAEDRARIQAILGNGRDRTEIHAILQRYDAIDRSIQTARDYAQQSIAHLSGLPVHDETALSHLKSLADYVIARRY